MSDEPIHAAAENGDLEGVKKILAGDPSQLDAKGGVSHSPLPFFVFVWEGK